MTEQIEARLSALERVAFSHSPSNDCLDDDVRSLDAKLRALAADVQSLRNTQLGRDDALAARLERRLTTVIANAFDSTNKAVGTILKEERSKTDAHVGTAVAGVQRDAETARSVTRSALESAETVLTGYAYQIGEQLREATDKAEQRIKAEFSSMDAALARLDLPTTLPRSASPGTILRAMLADEHTPADPIEASKRLLTHSLDVVSTVDADLDKAADLASDLASVADHLLGRNPLAAAVPAHVRAAALQLGLARAAYPVPELASKLDALATRGLSDTRDFQSKMIDRWRSALTVAHANNLTKALGRLSRTAPTTKDREVLAHQAMEWMQKAESLRNTHRAKFPKSGGIR